MYIEHFTFPVCESSKSSDGVAVLDAENLNRKEGFNTTSVEAE